MNYVDAAIDAIREHVQSMPAGIGVDAPLWWCSGSAGIAGLTNGFEMNTVSPTGMFSG